MTVAKLEAALEADVFKETNLAGTERLRVHAAATGKDYTVWVSLPPGYEAGGERRYPMLLALDGALHFSVAATAAWYHMLERASEELIVVGISTAGPIIEHHIQRCIDYAPAGMAADQKAQMATALTGFFASEGIAQERCEAVAPTLFGGAEAFRRFVDDELLPFLLDRYHIDPDALGLAGHSLGGAYGSYALIKGSPFTRYLIASFGVVWYGDTLPELEAEFARGADERTLTVYESHGQAEEEMYRVMGDVFGESGGLLDRLAASRPGRVTVTHAIVPAGGHAGSTPASMAAGIKALFPKIEVSIP